MKPNWQYLALALALSLFCWYLVTGREKVDTWMTMPLSELRQRLGAGALPILRRLVAMELVALDNGAPDQAAPEAVPEHSAALAVPPLTEDQAVALAALAPVLDAPDGAARLVYGVTGSGKTRLYLELARLALERGRRVLLLAPEVALAARLHQAACQAFPDVPALFYHGYQPPAVREAAFRSMCLSPKRGFSSIPWENASLSG